MSIQRKIGALCGLEEIVMVGNGGDIVNRNGDLRAGRYGHCPQRMDRPRMERRTCLHADGNSDITASNVSCPCRQQDIDHFGPQYVVADQHIGFEVIYEMYFPAKTRDGSIATFVLSWQKYGCDSILITLVLIGT